MSSSHTVERPVSPHELGFLELDIPTRKQVVSGAIFLTGSISLEALQERVGRMVENNSQYRCRIVGDGHFKWERDQAFELSRHCVEYNLGHASHDEVLTFIANQAAQGFSDEPTWRIALLNFCDSETRTMTQAVAIWAHHALLDGLQGFQLLRELTDGNSRSRTSSGNRKSDQTQSEPPRKTHLADRLLRLARTMADVAVSRRKRSPLTSPSGSTSRRSITIRWQRAEFARSRKLQAASLQELLVSVLAGGLTAYAQQRGHRGSLRAILPVGRPAPATPSFTTNRHDIGYLTLPKRDQSQSDPLNVIRRNLMSLAGDQRADTFQTIIGVLARLPRRVRKMMYSHVVTRADTLISIMPARVNRTLCGAKISQVYAQPAIVPGHGVSFGVVITAADIRLTMQYDPAALAAPEELVKSLEVARRQCLGRHEETPPETAGDFLPPELLGNQATG